jgi:hypothetical protein
MHGLERDLSRRCKTVDEFAQAFCTAAREQAPKRTGFLTGLFRKGSQ